MSTLTPKVHTVLVRTKYAANIGAAARATANISASGKLILINPRTSINSQSRKMAAGAQDTLDQHESFADWSSFLEHHPEGIRLALSRRSGKNRKPLSLPDSLHRVLSIHEHQGAHIYLVFGPEEDGLSAEDLDQCHMTCFLPAYGSFKSLNIAQAVLLAHYVTGQSIEKIFYGKDSYAEGTLEQYSQMLHQGSPLFHDQELQELLRQVFPDTPDQTLSNSFESLRRMILRSTPTHKELELFNLLIKKCLDLHTTCVDDTKSRREAE